MACPIKINLDYVRTLVVSFKGCLDERIDLLGPEEYRAYVEYRRIMKSVYFADSYREIHKMTMNLLPLKDSYGKDTLGHYFTVCLEEDPCSVTCLQALRVPRGTEGFKECNKNVFIFSEDDEEESYLSGNDAKTEEDMTVYMSEEVEKKNKIRLRGRGFIYSEEELISLDEGTMKWKYIFLLILFVLIIFLVIFFFF